MELIFNGKKINIDQKDYDQIVKETKEIVEQHELGKIYIQQMDKQHAWWLNQWLNCMRLTGPRKSPKKLLEIFRLIRPEIHIKYLEYMISRGYRVCNVQNDLYQSLVLDHYYKEEENRWEILDKVNYEC